MSFFGDTVSTSRIKGQFLLPAVTYIEPYPRRSSGIRHDRLDMGVLVVERGAKRMWVLGYLKILPLFIEVRLCTLWRMRVPIARRPMIHQIH